MTAGFFSRHLVRQEINRQAVNSGARRKPSCALRYFHLSSRSLSPLSNGGPLAGGEPFGI
jgi:hypothetical protein